jgi:hypothetical protein
MVRAAFIEESGNGRMEDEMRNLHDELQGRGIPVTLFVGKKLTRRQLPLTKDILVAGYVATILEALRQLEVSLPTPDDYPECLHPFLHRRVWESSVAQLQRDDFITPVFAKPRGRLKRFTGNVFASPADLMFLEGASRKTLLWCSEVVKWASEYRVFVLRGKIVGMRLYAGDASLLPEPGVVQEIVATLEASGTARAAYALDIGVLQEGRTALVEMNDAYALGSYGLEREVYTELILARWEEILTCQDT